MKTEILTQTKMQGAVWCSLLQHRKPVGESSIFCFMGWLKMVRKLLQMSWKNESDTWNVNPAHFTSKSDLTGKLHHFDLKMWLKKKNNKPLDRFWQESVRWDKSRLQQ